MCVWEREGAGCVQVKLVLMNYICVVPSLRTNVVCACARVLEVSFHICVLAYSYGKKNLSCVVKRP